MTSQSRFLYKGFSQRGSSLTRTSQSGFVTTAALAWTPLLLALMMVWILAESVTVRYSNANHICRVRALAIQQYLMGGMNKLSSLNPEAKLLREQIRMTERALAAALPWQKAAIQARLIALKAQQRILDLKQKRWLMTTQYQVQMQIAQLKKEMGSLHTTIQFSQHPGLHIQKKPPTEPAPEYFPQTPFGVRQNLEIKWNMNLEPWIPNIAAEYLMQRSNNNQLEGLKWIQGSCRSTVTKDSDSLSQIAGDQWKARLGLAKF